MASHVRLPRRLVLLVALAILMMNTPLAIAGELMAQSDGQVPAIAVEWNGSSIAVRGSGFTPGGVVTVMLSPGVPDQVAGFKASISVVSSDGGIDVRFLMGVDGYGPNGSQDPAWSLEPGMVAMDASARYGPNGSQDPAWSLVTGMMVPDEGTSAVVLVPRSCDPDDRVLAHDTQRDTWADPVVVPC